MSPEIELGAEVCDTVSGFRGIATARCTYVAEAPQVQVTPKVSDDGSYNEPQWFAESRLEMIS